MKGVHVKFSSSEIVSIEKYIFSFRIRSLSFLLFFLKVFVCFCCVRILHLRRWRYLELLE